MYRVHIEEPVDQYIFSIAGPVWTRHARRMDIVELESELRRAAPAVSASIEASQDPWTWADEVFGRALMTELVKLALEIDGDTARSTVAALAELLDRALVEADDDLRADLASVVVDLRLCSWPRLLETAWPYLGPETRLVAATSLSAAALDRR
jgi:hypothetical protein